MAAKKNSKSYQYKREEQDRKDFELILEAYKYRGINKGRRGIHMRLLQNGILMNEKKISRLMKKYNLVCPIRKANPYRRMMKALKSSNYANNLLERRFEEYGPGYVLLTDITYFYFSQKRTKAYLSVIKDAFFGHMKDEIGECFKEIEHFEKLEEIIYDYIDYYNNERYQYNLAKLSPNQFYEYYQTGEYPLKECAKEPDYIREKLKKGKDSFHKESITEDILSSNNSSSI